MDGLHLPNRTYFTLAEPQYLGVGCYLVISGFFVAFANILGVFALLKNYKVFGVSAIAEASLILGDLAVSGLHPFSGSAALANRWIWGPIGCQLYSLFGFLFGNFQMVAIPFIAFDRYIEVCRTPFSKFRNLTNYLVTFVLLFAFSLFWALLPLFGWSSYALTRVQISCTLDWMKVDTSFATYCTAYMFCIWLAPLAISGFLYKRIYTAISNRREATEWISGNKAGLIIVGRCIVTPLCGLAYGVVCIMALCGQAHNIPNWLTILPPVTLKFAGILNPLFYIFGNPQMWAAVRKLLGWSYNEALLVGKESVEKVNLRSTGVDPMSVRNNAQA